jgi:hypothetical protein
LSGEEEGVGGKKAQDGLYQFNYFKAMLQLQTTPGEDSASRVTAWLNEVIDIVGRKLSELDHPETIKGYSKWVWFAYEFRRLFEGPEAHLLAMAGVSPSKIPWRKWEPYVAR